MNLNCISFNTDPVCIYIIQNVHISWLPIPEKCPPFCGLLIRDAHNNNQPVRHYALNLMFM